VQTEAAVLFELNQPLRNMQLDVPELNRVIDGFLRAGQA